MPKLKPTIAIGTIGYSPLIQLKTLPHIVALQSVFAICRICISNCNLTHSFGKIKIIYIYANSALTGIVDDYPVNDK